MSVSVIVPTHSRPDFLREALESIARQSAVKEIDRVIVSDNGSGSDAEAVCRRFYQTLPIEYTKREPCPAHEHGKLIFADYFSGVKSKYTAILHDDDQFCGAHLATALHALESVPTATFYAGCHYDVRSMNSMLFCTHNFYAWFAASFARLDCAWIIPPENAVLTCILGCVGHYSTMVMRTDAFKKAAWIYDEPDANFDNDVRLQFALSQMGPLVYNPMPLVFVRHHEERDCVVNFTDDERIRHRRLTTQWIIKRSDIPALLDKFCTQFDLCPAGFKNNAAQYLSQECVLPEIGRYMKKHGMTYDKELPGIFKICPIAP